MRGAGIDARLETASHHFVIALLVSLLLPAIGQVRQAPRTIVYPSTPYRESDCLTDRKVLGCDGPEKGRNVYVYGLWIQILS